MVLNLASTSRGVMPAAMWAQSCLERDLQAPSKEGHEDVGLDAFHALVKDRAYRQVVLEFLQRLLHFGELDVELLQLRGIVSAQIGAQQVASLAPPHLAQFGPIKFELHAGRCHTVFGNA